MIWSTYARPDEGRELPPSKSSYLDDEARIIAWGKFVKRRTASWLNVYAETAPDPFYREAARRELLRRSLAVGVKG
jgi:hypothetical protein